MKKDEMIFLKEQRLEDSSIHRRYLSDLKSNLLQEGFELYDKIVQLPLQAEDEKMRYRLRQHRIHDPPNPVHPFLKKKLNFSRDGLPKISNTYFFFSASF